MPSVLPSGEWLWQGAWGPGPLYAVNEESEAMGNLFGGLNLSQCDQSGPIYCFGDDSSEVVPVTTPQPNRLAFLSSSEFSPSSGLAAADTICQRDACEAGLTGSTNCNASLGVNRIFRAYLHTSAQPAWERFNLDGPNWVRPDGIEWLPAARDLATDGRNRLTELSVALGPEYNAGAGSGWVGNEEGTATCADWTSSTALGAPTYYRVLNAGPMHSFNRPLECSTPGHIYCLEQ